MNADRKTPTRRTSPAGHGGAGVAPPAGPVAAAPPAEASPAAGLLADILERISDGFVAFDAAMNYTYVNERAAALLGRRAADLVGKNYWQEYPEAAGTPFADAYANALATQTTIQFESYYAPWDRWFENRIHPSSSGLAIFFTEITVRKRAELALQASEQRLARILETVPDGILIIDRDGAISYANAGAEALLGLQRDDITRRAYNDPQWRITTVAGEPFPDEALPFARVMRSGESVYGVEHAIVQPDGRRTILSVNATPLRDPQGAVAGMVAAVTDITERRLAEAAIRRERDFSNAMLDSLPGVFYFYDADLRFLRWNKNLETVSGYSAEEVAAMSPLDFFAGAERQMIAERIGSVFDQGTAEVEAQFVAKDGTSRPYYFNGLRTRFEGKDCLIGVGWDITERRRTEAAVAASESRLALIFDTVGDVIFLLAAEVDGGFRFASVNHAFLTVTGLRLEQVVGKRVEEVLPESAQAFVLDRYRQAIRTGATVRWEEVSTYPSGTLYGEVAVTPACDAAGVCTHLIGSVHDITALRRAGEEIRQLNLDLEQRVVERTAQLAAANRELATANKELEAFSYSVSHDLRAPLRAVSGFAEIIARRHRASLDDEGRHYFDNIVKASERMGQLIDALLGYSRLGHRALRPEAVPLRGVLAPLAEAMAPQLQAAGARLTIAADLPAVAGDRTLLEQVFCNLLDNALIYRRPDVAPEIAVDWRRDGGTVVVSVADNGIGIPAEFHHKIFDIFQRLHGEERYPGTGIGLATVERSVARLGGEVWVESVPGEGSTFCVRLPAEER